jgi:hypothetical protein
MANRGPNCSKSKEYVLFGTSKENSLKKTVPSLFLVSKALFSSLQPSIPVLVKKCSADASFD